MKTSPKQLIQSIKKHRGVISAVSKELGISCQAIYKRCEKNKNITAAIDEAREDLDVNLLDIAERKILAAVEDGAPWAVRYVLNTKGRARGWGEKTEIEHSGSVVQQMVMVINRVQDDGTD